MRVITNTAVSIDGRIAFAGGAHATLGSVTDRRYMSVLRARADAVLVGGATFRAWPLPSAPDPAAIDALRADGFPDTEHPPLDGRRWWNVVVTRTMDVPRSRRFLEDPRTRPLFLTSVGASGPDVEVAPEVTVPWMLERLAARGVQTLLVEAGGDLIAQFLAAGAVDELFVTVCPLVVGGRDAPGLAGGRGFDAAHAPRLRLLHAHHCGDEIYCRYAARSPGETQPR